MTIGGSIALIIVGAILTYAVEFDVQGVDIGVIGAILMIGGLIGLIFGLVMLASTRRRSAVVDYPAAYQAVPAPTTTVVERPARRTEVVDY